MYHLRNLYLNNYHFLAGKYKYHKSTLSVMGGTQVFIRPHRQEHTSVPHRIPAAFHRPFDVGRLYFRSPITHNAKEQLLQRVIAVCGGCCEVALLSKSPQLYDKIVDEFGSWDNFREYKKERRMLLVEAERRLHRERWQKGIKERVEKRAEIYKREFLAFIDKHVERKRAHNQPVDLSPRFARDNRDQIPGHILNIAYAYLGGWKEAMQCYQKFGRHRLRPEEISRNCEEAVEKKTQRLNEEKELLLEGYIDERKGTSKEYQLNKGYVQEHHSNIIYIAHSLRQPKDRHESWAKTLIEHGIDPLKGPHLPKLPRNYKIERLKELASRMIKECKERVNHRITARYIEKKYPEVMRLARSVTKKKPIEKAFEIVGLSFGRFRRMLEPKQDQRN